MLQFLFRGCSHDWEYLEHITRNRLRHQIESSIAGHYLPIGPDDETRLYRRCCLKCGAVEDSIATAREEILAEIRIGEERRMRALEIYKQSEGRGLCPQ